MEDSAAEQTCSCSSHDTSDETYSVLISYKAKSHTFILPVISTVADLSLLISDHFSIPPTHQKLLAPKQGLLQDQTLPITSLPSPPKKIMLMGSTTTTIKDVEAANSPTASTLRKFGGTGPIAAARPAHRVEWQKATAASIYTFGELNPLRHLPNWERSRTYLARLRDDPGIKVVMTKHKFTVPLLSEMDPAEHTTSESRTLGLNKNAGEEILLRLRTDEYNGYRDYNTVRKTLCHELAHNVHGEHERPFWDLYKVIVEEVERADWAHGGRSVNGSGDGGRMRWEGEEEEKRQVEREDGGGFTGGSFVLGGGGSSASGAVSGTDRRALAARAAEERIQRLRKSQDGGGA